MQYKLYFDSLQQQNCNDNYFGSTYYVIWCYFFRCGGDFDSVKQNDEIISIWFSMKIWLLWLKIFEKSFHFNKQQCSVTYMLRKLYYLNQFQVFVRYNINYNFLQIASTKQNRLDTSLNDLSCFFMNNYFPKITQKHCRKTWCLNKNFQHA